MKEKRRKRKTEKLRKEFARIRTRLEELNEQPSDEREAKKNWRKFENTLKQLKAVVAKWGEAVHELQRHQRRCQRKRSNLETAMRELSKQYG